MPVSKNKRKSKKAQSRKVNRAKAGGNFGESGAPSEFDHPPPLSPQGAMPELMPLETSIDENRRYQVNSPDDQALSEMEQIDAAIERSVTFEMTEAHHDNIGLREIDLDGEMGSGDIAAPMVATIRVDPLSTIEGHPKWQTGQELIEFLNSDPNVFRGEFNGNRWQGSGARWDECPPNGTGLFVPSGGRGFRDTARMRAVQNGVATGGGPLSLHGRKQHPDNVRRVLVKGPLPGR